MAGSGSGSAQGRARGESVRDIIQLRRREAEAAAYEAVKQAIRAGADLQLKTPSEVLTYGAKLLQAKAARAAQEASNALRVTKPQVADAMNRLSQNQNVKTVAGDVARTAGNVTGVVRGGVHAAEGLIDGAAFVNRLLDPLDILKSPKGQSAIEQLGRGALNAGRQKVDYIRKGVADPESVVRDVNNKVQQWRRELDPTATPVAPTLAGELRRNFDIGQNQGELAFDVGSLVVGGPAAKAVKGLGRISNVGNAEKYLAQGLSPGAAAHLAQLYPASNLGHHLIPRRARLPKFLGGGPLPRSYSDGPFNKLAPPGISRGDFYELHYKVDPHFHGTGVRGERWSGRDLGLKKHGPMGQLWHGSPAPLKARVGGLGAAAGDGVYDLEEGDQGW